jgi:PilZ domain-containing protein
MSINQCDARRAERISLGVPVFILIHAEGRKLRHKSQMMNVSWAGTKLKTAVTVLPGQTVQILPAQSPLRFVVRGRVVWTDRSVLGVDFFEPLPTNCWSLGVHIGYGVPRRLEGS